STAKRAWRRWWSAREIRARRRSSPRGSRNFASRRANEGRAWISCSPRPRFGGEGLGVRGNEKMTQPKKVAAIVTEYRRWSHADVIVGKIIEGFYYDGKDRPDMRLASLYVDQFPDKDMSRDLARKFKFPIYDTIEKALTLGGKKLAVDGVLCIGEHGKYPTNARGQILYPRRRFFEEVTKVFAKSRKAVPVFNDKHLAATWKDAKWMYDKSRELFVPFMAGSSVPLTWRKPVLKLEKKCS